MSETPQPSATVVLLRDGASGIEALYLRRNSKLAFHGGAWVFPGGRVDPEDAPGEDRHSVEAGRAAAVREAREEASVELDAGELFHLSRWVTPVQSPRRFDTHFFVGAARGAEVQVDGGEIHEHRWLTPQVALAGQSEGTLELPPPTFVTTTQLSSFATVDAALAGLRAEAPILYRPRLHKLPDGACSLYERDAAYADGDLEKRGSRHRLWMIESGWRYECAP